MLKVVAVGVVDVVIAGAAIIDTATAEPIVGKLAKEATGAGLALRTWFRSGLSLV